MIPAEALARLKDNHLVNERAALVDNPSVDLRPVVKLFLPTSAAVWLITEFDEKEGLLFGLCDLGLGCPEIGYVAVSDLLTAIGPLGIRADRDTTFIAQKSLNGYAAEARWLGYINA
ncbi:transposase [Phyllobacterium sophorae]|uniref:Transposase n=1 Tax=Phyllobacterium sophorae TaxID=1520277 RepID=A0A2P7B3B9_9HYPH|nr:transposase [Phyllobacterium sophorae]